MAKYKNKYRIESNRWRYWDYSAPGQYFLTICIENRKCILGKIRNGKMILSPAGDIVKSEIENIPTYHTRIILDEWVIMPNHIHMIIELIKEIHVKEIHEFPISPSSSPTPTHQWWNIPNYQPNLDEIKQYRKFRRKMIIPKIMGKWKMITSKQINILNHTPGYKNWQSDYNDHVIRNQRSYFNIKKYIINNPKNWKDDTFFD